ncbi:unnamed protein product [Sphagnum jensenii]|uniref:Uncharacterized protein n=1 Tax=Sphagnum jensenii TaxID=128206 RepID=A0ABP1BDL0_9BRYO
MASSSASSVALYIGALVVLALVNLMSESFVEGRSLHLDEGISMVTEALPQQQYFSLPAERFTEFLGNTPSVVSFASFVTKYQKVYRSLGEIKHRFATFLENLELIEATNKKKLSYTLGINEFADLTFDEMRSMYLMNGEQNCSATKGNHVLTDVELPTVKDWRPEGIVSRVKNQAHCGSCWTFSTTGALEAAHAQATGKMVLLSEQQLVDCAGDFNNFGCGGGLPSQAFEYIRYNGGLDTEEAYPYDAKDGTCKFLDNKVGAKVYDVVNITEGAENELKHAVATLRPVSVAFEVINSFRLYKSGVFSDPDCRDSPQTVNHAVLAVGFGVDENGTPYWIIKNSWGADWGINGYFHMELGKNMCGIATCAAYPVVPEDLKKSKM